MRVHGSMSSTNRALVVASNDGLAARTVEDLFYHHSPLSFQRIDDPSGRPDVLVFEFGKHSDDFVSFLWLGHQRPPYEHCMA